MVIVDTSVWVDFIRGTSNAETGWLRAASGREAVALTDLILCELLQGAGNAAMVARIEEELAPLAVFSSVGEERARRAAGYYREMRRRGQTVRGTVDCLIATFCLQQGHLLLHRDRGFDRFEQELGLRVLHPEPASA